MQQSWIKAEMLLAGVEADGVMGCDMVEDELYKSKQMIKTDY